MAFERSSADIIGYARAIAATSRCKCQRRGPSDPREEQVVGLVAEGLSNREIARELQLSEHTIKKYLFRIFDKLGISTRVELVLYAVSNGKTVGAERLPALAWRASKVRLLKRSLAR